MIIIIIIIWKRGLQLISDLVLYFLLSDVNECRTGEHNCQQLCSNLRGAYSCSCNTGFMLNDDSRTCSGRNLGQAGAYLEKEGAGGNMPPNRRLSGFFYGKGFVGTVLSTRSVLWTSNMPKMRWRWDTRPQSPPLSAPLSPRFSRLLRSAVSFCATPNVKPWLRPCGQVIHFSFVWRLG